MKAVATTITILILASTAALAQSPYAGMQTRSIKALSTQQIDDLRASRGMGLALAAELNGYPGPAHVLELSDWLALSPAQKERIKKLFESMKVESAPIGARLIDFIILAPQQSRNLPARFFKGGFRRCGSPMPARRVAEVIRKKRLHRSGDGRIDRRARVVVEVDRRHPGKLLRTRSEHQHLVSGKRHGRKFRHVAASCACHHLGVSKAACIHTGATQQNLSVANNHSF